MKLNGTLIIGLIVVAVLLLGAGYALANVRGAAEPAGIEIIPPAPTATAAPPPTPLPTATSGPLRVYVSGAVVNPAVYTLPPGSIIDDAVRAAGGFSSRRRPGGRQSGRVTGRWDADLRANAGRGRGHTAAHQRPGGHGRSRREPHGGRDDGRADRHQPGDTGRSGDAARHRPDDGCQHYRPPRGQRGRSRRSRRSWTCRGSARGSSRR
jgi:hypothetical protein